MVNKIIISLLLLSFTVINSQFISFDVEPRSYDIRNQYIIGYVEFSLNSTGLCDVTSCSSSLNLIMNIGADGSWSPYQKQFSFFDLVTVPENDPSILTYAFTIFPNGIDGNVQVSFSIFVDGVFISNITTNQITAGGSNPYLQVIKPLSKVNLVNLTIPDIVDLSTLDPVIITLSFHSDILIKYLSLAILDPNNEQINIFLDQNFVLSHDGPNTLFRTSLQFSNRVGVFTIQSIMYTLTNGGAGTFDTMDLLSLNLPSEFSNKPSNSTSTLPSPTDISIYISDKFIPISWSKKSIYVSITFGNFDDNLASVYLFLTGQNTSIPTQNLIFSQKFPFPVKNSGASFNVTIDTFQAQTYSCYFLIWSEYFAESLNVSCGIVEVYSPFPEDLTPPQVISVVQSTQFQNLITVELSDADSGISKIEIPAFLTLYNNQKFSGTDKNCIYQFYLATDNSNFTTPMLVYDFNHNVYDYNLTVNIPFSTLNVTNYNPVFSFDAPTNIELTNPMTADLFFNYQNIENCDYENLIFIQALPIINRFMSVLSSYQNIINGTACNGIIGDVFVYPQIRDVLRVDYTMIGVLQQYHSVQLPYSSIVNAEEPYLKFQPVLLTDFSASAYNITSGDSITFTVKLNSISKIYNLNITIIGLNQQFIFPLKNTVGTYYVGEWKNTVQIPTYANNGTWTINVDYFTYPNENSSFSYSNILSKGFNPYLAINSIVDLVPPSVEYVDSSTFASTSEVMVRVVDTNSGVKSISMILTPNNITNIQDASTYFTYYEGVTSPGNTSNINFLCKFNIPPYVYSGQYWMYFTVTDYSGNSVIITPDNLRLLDIEPTFVNIIASSGTDIFPPQVLDLTFSTNSITSFPSGITATIKVIDNLSGIDSFYLFLNGSGNTWLSSKVTNANRMSGAGTSIDPAIFSVNINFVDGMKPSNKYQANIKSLIDNAGNSIDYPYGYLATISGSNKIVTVNTGTIGSTTLPVLALLTVSTNLIDLAATTPITSITLTATFTTSPPLQFTPNIILQHSTQLYEPIIQCISTSSNGNVYQYSCDVSNFPTGYYWIHVKSFGDQNGNFNSCFKCNSLMIIDSAKPMFGEFSSVPTTGGRAYFNVENFINSTSTKILIEGDNCPGFQFESNNIVSCEVSNGTGTLNIQGYSSGQFTNILSFSYWPPHIESTTSVLPSGGDVVIYGENFGNSSSASDITILIGSISCIPFSVNDTIIFCKLPPYTSSNTVFKDVIITVDGITSNDGSGKFQYNDPPNTPCSPSATCSGNGQCISGVCLCKQSWSGIACEQKTFVVPTNTNTSNPTVIITPNSTNQDISTLMTVSVIAFNEINPFTNKIVKTNNFTEWTYTQSANNASNNFLYTTNIQSAKISVLLQVFKNPASIEFAGQETNIPANGMKYSINITNYPWSSVTNIGQLVMKSELLTQIKDETFCSGINQTESGGLPTDGDNIRYIKISQGNFTMFGKFSNRAVIDGRPTIISNVINGGDINLGDQASASSLIGVNVPHFYKSCYIDPDFSVLINPSYENQSENDHLCSKSSSGLSKWKIAVIASVCGIVGIGLVIAAVYFVKRYRMDMLLNKSLSSHST